MKRPDSDFLATIERFRELLRQNGYPEHFVWLMPEDVLVTGRRFLYVRVPVPAANEAKARRLYDEGSKQGHGLLISTVCEMKAATGCYVWCPRSREAESQGLWPQDGGVKLSVKTGMSRITGVPVKNRLLWALLKARHRGKQDGKDLLFG